MIRMIRALLLPCLCVAWHCQAACQAAEIVTITPDNLAASAAEGVPPAGKETDWIIGDHVLRNDRIIAVVARPGPTRNANMTVRNVGGCIIDLTERGRQNDQLSAFYPGGNGFRYEFVGASADGQPAQDSATTSSLSVRGSRVELRIAAAQAPRHGVIR